VWLLVCECVCVSVCVSACVTAYSSTSETHALKEALFRHIYAERQ
jgi:hypothetical protein